MKTQKLDIATSLTYFFKLKDWKTRTLYLGGIPILGMILIFISSFLMIIPIIGWILGGIIFLCLPFIFFGYQVYTSGYMLEIINTVYKKKKVEKIKVSTFTKSRLARGFKMMISQLIYNFPSLILISISYGLLFVPMIIFSNDEENPIFIISLLVAIAVFFIILIIIMLYQLFYTTFIFPASIYSFLENKTFSSFFNFKFIKKFSKANWKNLIYFVLTLFAIGGVFYFIYMIGYFLVFLCIGLFIFPIIIALGATYITHTVAHILGQIYQIHDSES